MQFYSHARKNNMGMMEPTKELKKHLDGVAANIRLNIHAHLNFNDFQGRFENQHVLGVCHDIGKYTTWFQEYLIHGKNKNEQKKNHALISAVFSYNFIKEFTSDKITQFIAYYCIKHHHGLLITPTKQLNSSYQFGIAKNLDAQTGNILNNSKNAIENLLKDKFERTNAFNLTEHYFQYNEREIRKTAHQLQKKSAKIDHYFMILYFFSLLIAADKIDAGEADDKFTIKPIASSQVNNYLKIKKNALLVDIRSKAKDMIEGKLNEIDVEREKLFTITAPTGIGKTLAAINFALKLKEKISSIQNYQPQIIYCLPFINIIEQTYKVINDLFSNQGVRILKHHQYTDIWAMVDSKKVSNREAELSKKLLEVEDWQADVVLTTFVQLFHSIITNQNKMLKKFHRLAGAIIILDEIQSIKAEYWPLIGTVLYCMSEFLNSRFILMTATQPLIFDTANTNIEMFKDDKIRYKKLLNDEEIKYFFQQFDRTKLISLIEKDKPIKNTDEFFTLFCKKWANSKSCLIVVNTISRSLKIFKKLQEEKISPHIYYLSTNLVPMHRKYVIRKISRLLKQGEKVILVSTQSIEAGVDLDFDMGFRDIGPLDSIIQVAGRINRNNRDGFKYSPLYIINFEDDSRLIYGRLTIKTTLDVLSGEKKYFFEKEYLDLIKKYYKQIVNSSTSFEESTKLFEAMKTLRFTKDAEEDVISIEDFQLIESIKSNYVDVYVPMTKKAAFALRIFRDEYLPCTNHIEKKKIYMQIKAIFNQYKISVPLQIAKTLNANSQGINELIPNKLFVIIKENIGYINSKECNILYDYLTGFCREKIGAETLVF